MPEHQHPHVTLPKEPDAPEWHGTQAESAELVVAVGHNAGGCTCHPGSYDWTGRMNSFHQCPGHAFLSETDEPGRYVEVTTVSVNGLWNHWREGSLDNQVQRVDRLLYARRMRSMYAFEEFTGEKRFMVGAALAPNYTWRTPPGRKEIKGVLPW